MAKQTTFVGTCQLIIIDGKICCSRCKEPIAPANGKRIQANLQLMEGGISAEILCNKCAN